MCNSSCPKTHVWRSNTLGHESWQRYSRHHSEANDCHIAPSLLTLHLLEEQCITVQKSTRDWLLQWIFLLSLEHHKTNITHPWKRRIIFLWGRCCVALGDEWNKVGMANGCKWALLSGLLLLLLSLLSLLLLLLLWWWWWWLWFSYFSYFSFSLVVVVVVVVSLLLLLVSVVLVHNADPPNPYPTLQETKWGKFWRPTPSKR